MSDKNGIEFKGVKISLSDTTEEIGTSHGNWNYLDSLISEFLNSEKKLQDLKGVDSLKIKDAETFRGAIRGRLNSKKFQDKFTERKTKIVLKTQKTDGEHYKMQFQKEKIEK